MALGVVHCAVPGGAEQTFSDLHERLTSMGWRVVGTVQQSRRSNAERHCDMDVRILPNGPVIRINQKLGPNARGCRLDTDALEMAVAAVEREFARGADVLIVNKFGKHEAEGRGFRVLIAEAIAQDIPVICGLSDLNQAAFEDFTGSIAKYLPNDPTLLEKWLNDETLLSVA